MAHTPVSPSGSFVTLNLDELDEFYYAASGSAIAGTDLIPNSGGEVDPSPTTQTTRSTLHSGLDIVTPGARTAERFTIRLYLRDDNPKLQVIKTDMVNKAAGECNMFYRDGSGHAMLALPVNIKTATGVDDFYKDVTFEPFNVEEIDDPAV